jgi:cytochrome c peroxidase
MLSLRGWWCRKQSVRRAQAAPNEQEEFARYSKLPCRFGPMQALGLLSAIGTMIGGVALMPRAAAAQSQPVPAWARAAIRQAQNTPPPEGIFDEGDIPLFLPQDEFDFDDAGTIETYMPNNPDGFLTHGNAFFTAHGITANGRSCITCHQPPTGWSVTPSNLQQRFTNTNGTDPVFDAVDGMGCPTDAFGAVTLSEKAEASSLLLNKGLFRIFLPVPTTVACAPPSPKGCTSGGPAQFTVQVVHDPYGCENSRKYGLQAATPIISVYRRPLPSTNLRFVTNAKGNIMWDGREASLESQASDATQVHGQAPNPPTTAEIDQMVEFEGGDTTLPGGGVFTAQTDYLPVGDLTSNGVTGGPVPLVTDPTGVKGNPANEPATVFLMYEPWSLLTATDFVDLQRESIARGEDLFNNFQFTISGVAGLNDVSGHAQPNGGPITTGTCSECHNQTYSGSDTAGGAEHNIGLTGDHPDAAPPTPDLPLFALTCTTGTYETAAGIQTVTTPVTFYTTDPGAATITGLCFDIGKLKVPVLRGLASRAPYFHNGSAPDLLDVVNFYDTRFSIGFTDQQKFDLVNFLETL